MASSYIITTGASYCLNIWWKSSIQRKDIVSKINYSFYTNRLIKTESTIFVSSEALLAYSSIFICPHLIGKQSRIKCPSKSKKKKKCFEELKK